MLKIKRIEELESLLEEKDLTIDNLKKTIIDEVVQKRQLKMEILALEDSQKMLI